MTESEAKGFVQGKLDCMKKCDIFNKEDKHSNNECDNCDYCYSQGNFGEQKEAFQMAINAIEKQTPKKPMQGEPYWWIDTVKVKGRNKEVRKKSYGHKCPCCGKGVAKLSNIFCNHCGQKLDWSDEE